MVRRIQIPGDHPLRKLFRKALDFGFGVNPSDKTGVGEYIEDQILCEFIHTDNLFKIKDAAGRSLEDVADMLSGGEGSFKAQNFSGEFQVHKHIGDYTLFMLGMFPTALFRRKGREFILGRLIIPGSSLFEHYTLQGQQSYKLASEYTEGDLFLELSKNFLLYRNVLELARIFLESARNCEYIKAKKIIGAAE